MHLDPVGISLQPVVRPEPCNGGCYKNGHQHELHKAGGKHCGNGAGACAKHFADTDLPGAYLGSIGGESYQTETGYENGDGREIGEQGPFLLLPPINIIENIIEECVLYIEPDWLWSLLH